MPRVGVGARLAAMTQLALCLTGCAEWNAGVSALNNYTGTQVTAQQANIQGVNDNLAKVWVDAGCALPYGEIVRNGSGNPNLAKAVILLCGQPGADTPASQ
jgi:hypothetical protein